MFAGLPAMTAIPSFANQRETPTVGRTMTQKLGSFVQGKKPVTEQVSMPGRCEKK